MLEAKRKMDEAQCRMQTNWYSSTLWYDLSKVRFGFWRKFFYRPVLYYCV
jgi:hypothetical protein